MQHFFPLQYNTSNWPAINIEFAKQKINRQIFWTPVSQSPKTKTVLAFLRVKRGPPADMGHHDTMLLHINTVLILMASFYRVWYKNRAPSHDPSQAWLNVKIWPHSHFSRLFFISVLTWSQQHYTYMCKYSQLPKKCKKCAKKHSWILKRSFAINTNADFEATKY